MYNSMYIAVAIGYGVLGYLAGWQRWQQWAWGHRFFWFGMGCVWALHASALHASISGQNEINLDVATAVSLLVAMAVAVYTIGQRGFWGHSTKEMYRFWHMSLVPSGIAAALPLLWPHSHPLILGGSAWTRVHWWIGLLSVATLCVATLQATWLAHWGQRLKIAPGEFDSAPSLLALEKALFVWVWISFGLLTIAVISGMFFSEQLWGYPFRWSHKVMFTMATWGLLAWMLWRRWREGIRGHTVARWLQWSCALVVLGYVGSKFVLEVLLKR